MVSQELEAGTGGRAGSLPRRSRCPTPEQAATLQEGSPSPGDGAWGIPPWPTWLRGGFPKYLPKHRNSLKSLFFLPAVVKANLKI